MIKKILRWLRKYASRPSAATPALIFLLCISGCHKAAPDMKECQEVLPPPLPMVHKAVAPGQRVDDGSVIDVMVLYTSAAHARAGSLATLLASIDKAVTNANIAYANSGVKQRIRLVYSGPLDFTETQNSTNDLSTFTWDSRQAVLRNQYGADCCSLICANLGGVCGTGYRLTSLTSAFAPYATNIVEYDCLTNLSLAHELGHNMGCSHDRANAGTSLFPFSFGSRTLDGLYRDIMAYSPGTRVNLFGGAGVLYSGRTLGDAMNDCRRTLDSTSKTVANFRLSIVSVPTPTPTPSPTPIATVTAVPSVTPTPTATPIAGGGIVNVPASPVIAGQTTLITWSLPAGGSAVDIYLLKAGVSKGQLKGGAANDGSQGVIIPLVLVGTDYQIMIREYSDLKTFKSDFFEIKTQ